MSHSYCSLLSGTTESLPWRASVEPSNGSLVFISASVTGWEMSLPALILTLGALGSLHRLTQPWLYRLRFSGRPCGRSPACRLCSSAQVLHRHRIGHAVPDGGLLFLQVGKAVNGGFGFEEIVHFFFIPSAAVLNPRSGARGPYRCSRIKGSRFKTDSISVNQSYVLYSRLCYRDYGDLSRFARDFRKNRYNCVAMILTTFFHAALLAVALLSWS